MQVRVLWLLFVVFISNSLFVFFCVDHCFYVLDFLLLVSSWEKKKQHV